MTSKDYIVRIDDDISPDAFAKFLREYSPEELTRCKDCVRRGSCELCDGFGVSREWFCADAIKLGASAKEFNKDEINKVRDGLMWIFLNNNKLGLGTYWPEDYKPQDEYEQAGYNIQRAIDFLTFLKGNLEQQ